MRSPQNIKEAQSMVGSFLSLSQFLLKLTKKIQPILKLIRKADKFKWDVHCKEAFAMIKEVVSFTPVIVKPPIESYSLALPVCLERSH